MKRTPVSIPVAAVCLTLSWALPLQAQETTWSIAPSVEQVRWGEAFGLEPTVTPALRLSVDFGPRFSLQPFGTRSTGVRLRPELGAEGEEGLRLRGETFGADLQITLMSGSFLPFVTLGGGVLRLETPPGTGTGSPLPGEEGGSGAESDRRADRILLRAGAGTAIPVGERSRVEFFVRRQSARLPEPFVPGAVPEADFPEDGVVTSTVLGGGVRIPLGAAPGPLEADPGIVPGLFVEPFAGRLEFHRDLGLARENLAGIRAGVDLTPSVGARGWLWRGVDEDFSERRPLQGVGGEVQFTLEGGDRLAPFALAGGGQIRFRSGLVDRDGAPVASVTQNHLLLGGGVAFRVLDRVAIQASARNLLLSVDEDFGDVSTPDDLRSNWLYSLGVSATVGGDPMAREARRRARAPEPAAMALSPQTEALLREQAEATDDPELRAALLEELERSRQARATAIRSGPRETITIPVPEVGEIILRFGHGTASVSADEATGLTPEQFAALERRLLESLAREGVGTELPDLVRRTVRQELQALGLAPPGPVAAPARPVPALSPADPTPGRRLEALELLTGGQVTEPSQFLLGLRANLGIVSEVVPLELVPELAFGVGEGDPSLLLGFNTRFGYTLNRPRHVEPYLMGGLALTNRRFMTVNVGYGVRFDLGEDPANPPFPRIFVEHQGIGLFSESRLLVGIILPR